jgi:hypothetical protein
MKQGKFYPFDQIPVCDSCWSLSTGPDGRIYAAACTEKTGGVGVFIVRYDEKEDALEYLVDVAQVSGDPTDSGRATQCKIHYCFNPSPSTGIMYAATHLSGPPINEFWYNPFCETKHPLRGFRGSTLIAYDTNKDEVISSDILLPGEGARCTCLDDERGLLYVLSYPRDHFFVYDLKRKELRDMGRISSVNSQAIFMDKRGRAFTANDKGRLLRYDPDKGELEELNVYLPVALYQSGWHAVIYDAAANASHDCIYGVNWIINPHLWRYWPEDGKDGRIEDLGPATQTERDRTMLNNTYIDHAGGLVFDSKGYLYYVSSRWRKGYETKGIAVENDIDMSIPAGVVVRIDPNSLERQDYAELSRKEKVCRYITRGGRDKNGNLFFGMVGPNPVGLFRLEMDETGDNRHLPLRMWG